MNEQAHQRTLVEAAKEGDEQAFGRLYELTRPELRAYVCKRLRGTFSDSELSADVVSETYLRAYRRLGLFDSERPVMPWLIVIARNILHDHFKSSRARCELPMDWIDSEWPDLFAPDPYESAEHVDRWRRAVRVLQSLTPDQRNVLVQRFYLDRTQAEVARDLGVSQGAVSQLTFRARRAAVRAGVV